MEHVPFKSNADSIASLLGNVTQVYFASVAAGKAYVDSGQLKIVAVAGPKRLRICLKFLRLWSLDIPTSMEATGGLSSRLGERLQWW